MPNTANVIAIREQQQLTSLHAQFDIPETPTIAEMADRIHALSISTGHWPDNEVSITEKLLTAIAWVTKASKEAEMGLRDEHSLNLLRMAIGQTATCLLDVASHLHIDVEMELIRIHKRKMGVEDLTLEGTMFLTGNG